MYADLGATIALPSLQTYFNAPGLVLGTRTPLATRPVATVPTTFKPPVIRPLPPQTIPYKPVATPLPVLKPLVSVAPTASTPLSIPSSSLTSGGGGDVVTETASMVDAFSFGKSPLPLILFGVAALLLTMKKGR